MIGRSPAGPRPVLAPAGNRQTGSPELSNLASRENTLWQYQPVHGTPAPGRRRKGLRDAFELAGRQHGRR